MYFKSMVIEGVDGDVTIAHTDGGALVTEGNRVICELLRSDSPERRYAKAREVAKVVCGVIERSTRFGGAAGEPNATNSMIHDVLTEMERGGVLTNHQRRPAMAIKWTRVRDGLYRGGGYEILSDDLGWIVRHPELGVIAEPFATVREAKAAAEQDRRSAAVARATSAKAQRPNWKAALDEVEALAVQRLGGLGGPAAGAAIRDVLRLAFQRGWEAGATAEGEYGPDFD